MCLQRHAFVCCACIRMYSYVCMYVCCKSMRAALRHRPTGADSASGSGPTQRPTAAAEPLQHRFGFSPSLKRISAHTQSPPTLRAQTEVMPGAQPTAAPNCSAQPAAAPLQQRPLEPCISMRIVRTMTRCDWRSTMATADVRRFRVPS